MLTWLGIGKAKEGEPNNTSLSPADVNARALLFGASVEPTPAPDSAPEPEPEPLPQSLPVHDGGHLAAGRPAVATSLRELNWKPVPLRARQAAPPIAATAAKTHAPSATATETQTVYVAMPHDPMFRTPIDLTRAEVPYKRALIIGSCFSDLLVMFLGRAFPGIEVDHILYNNAGMLPDEPPHPLDDYDFQIIMLPLRSAMPEFAYLPLQHDDIAGHQDLYDRACASLTLMIQGALGYHEKRPIISFVANFMVPQQNLMGRLLPRYDLRNPVFLIEQLNKVIAEEILGRPNVHLFDIDAISANFGRKYIQDDLIWLTSHGSFLSNYDTGFDGNRIEQTAPITHQHPERVEEYVTAMAHELRAMVRTIRQVDQVKLVIIDLDDTLWRGVIAEMGLDRPMVTEGWPSGFMEALAYLKKRGVLLAIVSKNDETRIRGLWPQLYGGRLELTDFASVKINWDPKPDNIERILEETNLLPRSVVFIDDNPVERANVVAAFPEIRLLGAQPYQLRRILLWSAETQVAGVTSESARRTEMVQPQVERETMRKQLTRAEFLETLVVSIRLIPIIDPADSRFARTLELVNKSNQFNTTGVRWTLEECQAAFNRGWVFWAFEVQDRFTRYGVVGVAITGPASIHQFVMSCRVVGLEVEIAVISALLAAMPGPVSARIVLTDANFLCRDLYARCGFIETDSIWTREKEPELSRPAHVHALEIDPVTAS